MALRKVVDEDPFAGMETLYGRQLKEIERKEIARNLGDFFAILHEWREEERKETAQRQKGEGDVTQTKSPGE